MDRFDIVRRGISRPSSVAASLTRSSLAVLIPMLLRFAIDRGAYGATMVVHLPAVLMIAVYLQKGWAVFALVGSVIAVLAMPPMMSAARPEAFGISMVLFSASAALMVVIGHYLRVTVLALQERTRQIDAFNQELQHRTKNTLQIVAAMASRTAKTSEPAAFYEALSGRLAAMAKANELLSYGALEACRMRQLVDAAIAPFNVSQIEVRGQDCSLSKEACMPLMMALHELSTNATKYGALSRAEGKVVIRWHPSTETNNLELEWTEFGGPKVEKPKTKGLGSRLLTPRGAIKAVSLRFHPEGVRCRLIIA